MVKQVASGVLGLFAVAWGWNYVAVLTGLPSSVGFGLGLAVAAFVALDPFHLIWTTAPQGPAQADSRQTTLPGAISSRV